MVPEARLSIVKEEKFKMEAEKGVMNGSPRAPFTGDSPTGACQTLKKKLPLLTDLSTNTLSQRESLGNTPLNPKPCSGASPEW